MIGFINYWFTKSGSELSPKAQVALKLGLLEEYFDFGSLARKPVRDAQCL